MSYIGVFIAISKAHEDNPNHITSFTTHIKKFIDLAPYNYYDLLGPILWDRQSNGMSCVYYISVECQQKLFIEYIKSYFGESIIIDNNSKYSKSELYYRDRYGRYDNGRFFGVNETIYKNDFLISGLFNCVVETVSATHPYIEGIPIIRINDCNDIGSIMSLRGIHAVLERIEKLKGG
jgi:hypothetical protein